MAITIRQAVKLIEQRMRDHAARCDRVRYAECQAILDMIAGASQSLEAARQQHEQRTERRR